MLAIQRSVPARHSAYIAIKSSLICQPSFVQNRAVTLGRKLHSMPKTAAKATKSALIPIGKGAEEMETVIIVDVLRRAGVHVDVASVDPSLEVVCSRGVKLVADAHIGDVKDKIYDLIALPGGLTGSEHLRDSVPLDGMLRKQLESGRLLGAICAAPYIVLEAKGLLKGRKATAYPGLSDKLADSSAAEGRVVTDGNLVTSRGPGTAIEFSLALVTHLLGEHKTKEVAAPLVLPPSAL